MRSASSREPTRGGDADVALPRPFLVVGSDFVLRLIIATSIVAPTDGLWHAVFGEPDGDGRYRGFPGRVDRVRGATLLPFLRGAVVLNVAQ